jgi:hypothetical protein
MDGVRQMEYALSALKPRHFNRHFQPVLAGVTLLKDELMGIVRMRCFSKVVMRSRGEFLFRTGLLRYLLLVVSLPFWPRALDVDKYCLNLFVA